MAKQFTHLFPLSMKLTGTVAASRFTTNLGAQVAAGGNSAGISRSAGVAGDMVVVDAAGSAVLESGAAIAAGATLQSDATGRGITWASGARTAWAMEAATAAGQFIEVRLLDNAA